MFLLVPPFFLLLSWFTAEHFPPWVGWHNEIGAFACGVWLFGWVLAREKVSGWSPLLLPKSAWLLTVLALVMVLQAVTGKIAFWGDVWVILFYLALSVFTWIAGYTFGHQNTASGVWYAPLAIRISQFAMFMLLGGLGSVVIALVQALDIWEGATWVARMPSLHRPGGNLAQPNQLATLILFSVVSLWYLFESRCVRALTAIPMAAVLLLGLAITESRTGALSLLLLAGWWMLKRRRLESTLSLRVVALCFVFFVTCFWFWPHLMGFLQAGGLGDAVATQVNTRAGTRLVVWPQLWQAVLQRPWLGWGLGSVSVAHNAVLDGYAIGEPFTYAHNIVLDLAVGVGLPLTLLLVIGAGIWLWRRGRDANDLISWYCLALALPFGVHSMLEFPFAYAYLLGPVVFLLGVLEARLAPDRGIYISWRTAAVCWTVASMAMIWSVFEYINIEEDFRVARFEAMHIGQTASDYERPNIYLLTQLGALMEVARIVPTPNMEPGRIELAGKVAMRFPGAATQNRYALSLALNGNPQEAIRQLKVMRAMHGEKTYDGVRANWRELAETKYPQLKLLQLP